MGQEKHKENANIHGTISEEQNIEWNVCKLQIRHFTQKIVFLVMYL